MSVLLVYERTTEANAKPAASRPFYAAQEIDLRDGQGHSKALQVGCAQWIAFVRIIASVCWYAPALMSPGQGETRKGERHEKNERTTRTDVTAWIDYGYYDRAAPWFDTVKECKEYCKANEIEYDFIASTTPG